MTTPEEERPFSETYATLESLRALARTWNDSLPMRQIGVRLDFTRVDRVRAVIDPVQPFHRGGMGTAAINGALVALTGTEPPHRATHWTGHTLEREVATSRAIPVVLDKLRHR